MKIHAEDALKAVANYAHALAVYDIVSGRVSATYDEAKGLVEHQHHLANVSTVASHTQIDARNLYHNTPAFAGLMNEEPFDQAYYAGYVKGLADALNPDKLDDAEFHAEAEKHVKKVVKGLVKEGIPADNRNIVIP